MFKVRFSIEAIKSLKKLDPSVSRMLVHWIEKNLEGVENPRLKGKGLSHDKKEIWRYRVGQYRLLTKISAGELIILVIDVGHRKKIYD